MYQYIKHDAIDFSKWDDCIDASPNGNIYTLSWYLNIVAPGWDAIISEESGVYDSVFPVTQFKKFQLLKFIKQPHFANQLGLVYRNQISEADLTEVLRLLTENFSYVINYPLNIHNNNLLIENSAKKILSGFNITRHPSYQLDLDIPYDSLFGRFTEDRRINIRRALRNKLSLSKQHGIENLIAIFKDHTSKRIYGGVNEYQYTLLRQLYLESSERGMAEIYVVKALDEVISGCFFFHYKNRIIKFFNTSTHEGRLMNGDSFLMNELLKRWSGRPKIFDFERASLEGINHYKESFGASQVFYPTISYDALPKVVQLIKKARYRLLSTQ